MTGLWPVYNGPADVSEVESVPLAGRDLPASTYDIVVRAAAQWADKQALAVLPSGELWESPQHWTFGELGAMVHRYANTFTACGVGRRDAVAVLSPNVGDLPAVLLAAEAAGVASPLNPALEPAVLRELLKLSGAKVLVAAGPEIDPELWQTASRLAKELGLTVFALHPTNAETPSLDVVYLREAAAIQPRDRLLAQPPAADDLAAYFHTGGTTGAPKLAAHTHANQVVMAWTLAAYGPRDTDETWLAGLPLFHVNAMLVTLLAPLLRGSSTVWAGPLGYRDPGLYGAFWRIVERYRLTAFSAVPMVYGVLAQVPIDADISSLRYAVVGAAPLPPAVRDAFESHTGVPLCEGYGMTEATCATTRNYPGAIRVGSVGLPLPYQLVKIVDDVVHIAGPTVFAGYVQPGGRLVSPVVDGWLNTGDTGRLDDDGWLYLRGRAKDVIIRGGHNIDPRVIEDALLSHPAVIDAAAVGRPDRRAGEVPIAFVTTSAEVTSAELVVWAADHVPEAAAAPKAVQILDALPMTSVGKQFKPALRKRAIHQVITDELAALGLTADISQTDDEVRLTRPADEVMAEKIADALNHYGFVWRFG